jgi:glycosyltransferase involved in cell wall biosynthesis
MSNPYHNKKIAILAAGSVRGEFGGAERFYNGLLGALITKECDARLVNIPIDESTFESILAAYAHVESFDFSEYDLVISTKAPTFAVNHVNHLLYLVHTTRVFYDMFDEAFPWANDALRRQRQTIQERDTKAIQRIQHRFTIGVEVSERLRKYNNIDSQVLHPPLAMNGFHPGETGSYFLLPGRLHRWKRVDLVIRAVRASKLPLKLIIAGTGEAEADLRTLADGDNRIEFLGRVSDTDLIELYANALAVPFVPMREDFGYVTLEAFASGKPVITCNDSGEPLQFVKHGVTGLVCDPQPASLCAGLEKLFRDSGLAKQLGAHGLRSIKHITWPNIAERLLSAGFAADAVPAFKPYNKKRSMNVAILDMQPIDPAVGGGRLRLLGLYHALGADLHARYVGTYDWPGEKYRHHNLTPSLEEIDVPLSEAHHAAAKQLLHEAGGKTVIDIAFPRQCHLSPEFLAKTREAIAWADIVIFSHPWVYPLVADKLKSSQLVVYDSQNVEGFLRAQLLDERNPVETLLLREVVQAEYTLGCRANLILTCSQEDLDLFAKIYEWSIDKIRVIPNAVMISKITPLSITGRIQAKKSVGLAMHRMAAIFIGSAYQPNIEAAEFIIHDLARHLPSCNFVIAGGVGASIGKKVPENVVITGYVDDQQKLGWLQACDFAVNPMFSGSGTNIKMFDFMAAGLPVVSTVVGARGIVTGVRQPLLIVENDSAAFVSGVRQFIDNPKELRNCSTEARACVEDGYSWERISPQLGRLLRRWKNGLAQPNRVPKLAHLSTVGHKCGIGEYTARLLDALVACNVPNYLVTCATSRVRPLVAALPVPGEIGWQYDDERWRDSHIGEGVPERLQAWGAEYVIVQYHSAFFLGAVLVGFAESCLRRGMGVAVEVHNFATVDVPSFRRLDQLGCLVIVHGRREVTDARTKGIFADYLPLSVPLWGKTRKSLFERNLQRDPPVIASTGFLRPHKGIPQVIEALAIVRRSYPGARLLLQCALYPSADSRQEYDTCCDKIHRLGLEEAVEFDVDFRPIEEVYRRLSSADIAVLPYADSSEGGSATAGTVLASGVPLLISRSPVFEDIAPAAVILPDTEPQTIATAICRLLDREELYDGLVAKGIDYAESNSVLACAQHLLRQLKSLTICQT